MKITNTTLYIIAGFLLVATFISTYWGITLGTAPKDVLVNFGSGFFEIAVAVILIDTLVRLRDRREQINRLVLQMRKPESGAGLAALEELKSNGWLHSGAMRGSELIFVSLEGASFITITASVRRARPNLFRLTYSAKRVPADLQGAVFWAARLQHTNLSRANLKRAFLGDAFLQNADLSFADLQKANLSGANMEQANLTGANLKKADLRGSNLLNAQLQGAIIDQTDFDKNTILPDGTICNQRANLNRFVDPSHPNFWKSDIENPQPA